MIPAKRDLVLRPGVTFGPHIFTALDVANNPVDLTGWLVWAWAKTVPDGALQLDLGPEILTAGSIGNFTADATTDLLTLTTHGLVAGVTLRFTTDDTLPGGLAINTNYYVLADGLTVDDFKVSLVPNGVPVDITSTGSGTQTALVGLGQVLIPEITDETNHDYANFKGKWDLIMENPTGQRYGEFVAGKFVIARGITNPDE